MRSDEELFAAYARKDDLDALSELVKRHERRLMAFLTGMLDAAEAEDAFQDTWRRIIEKASVYRGGVFASFLVVIARRIAIDRLRSRHPQVSLDAENVEGEAMGDSLPSLEPDPGESWERSATAEDIRRAISALPPGPRQVALLRIEGELAFKEIAVEMGVPLGTALNWMHVATQAIKQRIGG